MGIAIAVIWHRGPCEQRYLYGDAFFVTLKTRKIKQIREIWSTIWQDRSAGAYEKQCLYGRKCPIPSSCDRVEVLLRIELRDRLLDWVSKKATVLGCMSSDAILSL